MRNCNYLAAGIVLALLAACSADRAPVHAAHEGVVGRLAGNTAVSPARNRIASTRLAKGFASLPDRGELLAYDPVRRVKRSGAYTAYPVELSEEHALQAMGNGELVVNAPDGQEIRLRFERHVEHPDGNWTWIGRNAEGVDAVLTFGEKAVFGSIPQGAGHELRLTMNGGRSYLVATDRSQLSAELGVTRRRSSDTLIPPKVAAGSVAGPTTASVIAEPGTAAADASAGVVDVLVGYSDGFANELGGTSQANTRLANLIAFTNQAYANSGVSMRVRLVKTLQVNYPDNTDNGDVLEKLTGYKSGSGSITPDPAFNALRAAREANGADLVAFVRAFRTPENDGCGIAWAIGGGQSSITAGSAPFGYSVLSDGSDFDEGDSKTYFCRDETLAHELGHNMGQAHNSEIAEDPGAHAYSYGYRESSTSGFYTVMAYRIEDSTQFSIRHFSNPGVNFSGRPTGVANTSDNARSLKLTMPIVAGFRGAVVPVDTTPTRHDFNGDGVSDVLWRNLGTGVSTIWKSADKSSQQSVSRIRNLAWKEARVADFDGDGASDILWHNATTGASIIWRSGNSGTTLGVSSISSPDWVIAGVGDFNGDLGADILWRNERSGTNVIWYSAMRGRSFIMKSVTNLDWKIAGVGDFDGDGNSDVLWRNKVTGVSIIWRSGNSQTTLSVRSVTNDGWQIVAVADFNGDGRDDLFWRNSASGVNTIWRSANAADQQSVRSVTNTNWLVAASGDYNGDGNADVLWRNSVTGVNAIWRSANMESQKSIAAVTDTAWFVGH